jgi:hypothetical protein
MTGAREADEREIRLLIDSLAFDVVDVSLLSPVMSAGPLLSEVLPEEAFEGLRGRNRETSLQRPLPSDDLQPQHFPIDTLYVSNYHYL